jgi:putative ABC transport system ATP-binding protein
MVAIVLGIIALSVVAVLSSYAPAVRAGPPGRSVGLVIALALCAEPRLVIADEPTSALDTDNRAAFIKLLFEECDKQGSTLIFVSHDPHLEPLFPRVENLQQLNRRASC